MNSRVNNIPKYDLHETEESLVYVQARALNVIGLSNSSQKRLMELGYKSIEVVSAACSRLVLLDEIPYTTNQSQSEDLEHAWITWRVRESRRRTGLFVWVRLKSPADGLRRALSSSLLTRAGDAGLHSCI